MSTTDSRENDPRSLIAHGGLLEASAGTGKTYSLLSMVLRFLAKDVAIDQILMVTFTRAATSELRGKLRQRLGEALTKLRSQAAHDDELLVELLNLRGESSVTECFARAYAQLDLAEVHTIHGFCQRVIAKHAFACGLPFAIEVTDNALEFEKDAAHDFWLRELHYAPTIVVDYVLSKNRGFDKLADKLTMLRTARLVPSPTASPTLASFDRAQDALKQVLVAYRASRDEVIALLESNPALNRSVYRSTTLARAFACLDSWPSPTIKLLSEQDSNALEKLSEGALQAGCNKGKTAPQHVFFGVMEQYFEAYRALLADLDAFYVSFVHRLREHLQQAEQQRVDSMSLSFDDLLAVVDSAVARFPELGEQVRKHYRAALIDEFQDTDPRQFRIFTTLFGGDFPLILVGDPKQAIYSFRGADITAYLQAAHVYVDRTYRLATNHRSDKNAVDAVNALFSFRPDPFVRPQIPFTNVRAKHPNRLQSGAQSVAGMRVHFVPTGVTGKDRSWANARIAPAVAADILASLKTLSINEKPVEPKDFAILVRTNDDATLMERALRDAAIPSVIHSQLSVFATPEARELELIFASVAAPFDHIAFCSAASSRLLGLSADDIAEPSALFLRRREWVHELHDAWFSGGFSRFFDDLLAGVDAVPRLLSESGGERALTNWLHLGELLHQAERAEHHTAISLMRLFSRWISDPDARGALGKEAGQLRLETDAAAVTIITMHKSKGLEYPIVYVPFGTDKGAFDQKVLAPFHDPQNGLSLTIDLAGRPDAAAMARQEEFEESLRLLYVALTRARHQTNIFFGAIKGFEASPFGYLLCEGSPDARKAALTGAKDAKIRALLDALAASSNGAIAIETCAAHVASAGSKFTPSHTDSLSSLRKLSRELPADVRTESFTELVFGAHDDEVHQTADEAIRLGSKGKGHEPIALLDLPKGAAIGNAIHAIFESIDFSSSNVDSIVDVARDQLKAVDVSAAEFAPVVAQSIVETLQLPLMPTDSPLFPSPRLAMSEGRICEFEFLMPANSVTPTSLRKVFATEGSRDPDLPVRWVKSLSHLSFEPFSGSIKGFVDLLFVHAGRFFVVDYKTNFCGQDYASYAPTELTSVMSQHHYYLQYYLYSLAVHRYLGSRLPNYSFGKHFGGVFYLFLRGISARHEFRYGVMEMHPKLDVLNALSELFSVRR